MKIKTSFASILASGALLCLSACQTPSNPIEPTDLKNAILLAVDSIVDAAQEREDAAKKKAGLYAETAKITFFVKATKSRTTDFGASGGYGGLNLKISNQRVRANEHANTIEITLSSINKLDPGKPHGGVIFRAQRDR